MTSACKRDVGSVFFLLWQAKWWYTFRNDIPRGPRCRSTQTFHGCVWNAPNLMAIRALKLGSSFEQEATGTSMCLGKAQNALTNARFALFLAMRTERLRKETSSPKSLACLVEEIPKPFSCQPEHTIRAMPRVVAHESTLIGLFLSLNVGCQCQHKNNSASRQNFLQRLRCIQQPRRWLLVSEGREPGKL